MERSVWICATTRRDRSCFQARRVNADSSSRYSRGVRVRGIPSRRGERAASGATRRAAAGTCEYVRFDICYLSVPSRKLVWLHGEIKTPPFSKAARIEAGYLLRRLQNGERLSPPESRPMPVIGSSCHELRVTDEEVTWRIVYGLTSEAVVILEVFPKKTRTTPKAVIVNAQRRWTRYLRDSEDE